MSPAGPAELVDGDDRGSLVATYKASSTGRHHGAESLEESRVLLALDFAGDVVDVVSQPLKISFATCGKRRAHTPDYLAVTRRGVWLIDVRPEPLIKEADRESFAAAAEVAVACGWRYAVAAAGWCATTSRTRKPPNQGCTGRMLAEREQAARAQAE